MGGKPSVGLDIGASGIKAAWVTRDGNGYKIEGTAYAPLAVSLVSVGTVDDDDEYDRRNELAHHLTSFFRDQKLPSKDVTIGLLDPAVVNIAPLRAPFVQPTLLKQSLGAQLRRNNIITGDDSEYEIEPLVLKVTKQQDGGATLNMVAITARTEKTEIITDLVEEAKGQIVGVRHGALANMWADPNYRRSSANPALASIIVDVGASHATIFAHLNGIPLYVRTVLKGGNSATDALKNDLGLSGWEEAEQAKKLAEPGSNIAEALTIPASSIASESRTSIEDFLVLAKEKIDLPIEGIGSITMTGGGARLQGLPELMRSVTTRFSSPTHRVELRMGPYMGATREEDGPDYTVAVGLAVSALPPVKAATGKKGKS